MVASPGWVLVTELVVDLLADGVQSCVLDRGPRFASRGLLLCREMAAYLRNPHPVGVAKVRGESVFYPSVLALPFERGNQFRRCGLQAGDGGMTPRRMVAIS